MNTAVIYNLPTKRARASKYAETESDTEASAREVQEALVTKGAKTTLIPIDEDHINDINAIKADLLFNLIEWTGNDLALSDRAFECIEKTGIPFTGATRNNYLETSDKIRMKKSLERHNLPTARWQVITSGNEAVRSDFIYPVLIKPSLEHCSIGLSNDAIAKNAYGLRAKVKKMIQAHHQPMVVEEFIEGREFQVTVIEDHEGVRVLPAAEIIFEKSHPNQMLTYESRWEENSAEYKTSHVSVLEDSALQQTMDELAKKSFNDLSFRDYARLDIRMRGADIIILEINSNPGLGDDDEYGMTLSYRALGWTFADFVWKIVESATRRFQRDGSTH